MIPELPAKGVTSVTPPPMQRNLMSVRVTTTSSQGSPGVPAPTYLYPSEPRGLPSPRQPDAGSATNIDGEAPPVSMICSSPPSTVGSPVGRSN